VTRSRSTSTSRSFRAVQNAAPDDPPEVGEPDGDAGLHAERLIEVIRNRARPARLVSDAGTFEDGSPGTRDGADEAVAAKPTNDAR
jgi:hypothetical protein